MRCDCSAVLCHAPPRLRHTPCCAPDLADERTAPPPVFTSVFITNAREELVTSQLVGMPHSLLLSTSHGATSVLVPALRPARPVIATEPFSTALVLDRLRHAPTIPPQPWLG